MNVVTISSYLLRYNSASTILQTTSTPYVELQRISDYFLCLVFLLDWTENYFLVLIPKKFWTKKWEIILDVSFIKHRMIKIMYIFNIAGTNRWKIKLHLKNTPILSTAIHISQKIRHIVQLSKKKTASKLRDI